MSFFHYCVLEKVFLPIIPLLDRTVLHMRVSHGVFNSISKHLKLLQSICTKLFIRTSLGNFFSLRCHSVFTYIQQLLLYHPGILLLFLFLRFLFFSLGSAVFPPLIRFKDLRINRGCLKLYRL